MIVQLTGRVIECGPLRVVLDVNGVGYEVHIPITTAEVVPSPGGQVTLYIQSIYREDLQALYGFATKQDRDFFKLLVEKVSGIGPKIALSIMSKLSVAILNNAIYDSDVNLLSQCPGIGKKTAERLVIELRDKIFPLTSSTVLPKGDSTGLGADSTQSDALAALMALGYKASDADKAIRKALAKSQGATSTEDLIKIALG